MVSLATVTVSASQSHACTSSCRLMRLASIGMFPVPHKGSISRPWPRCAPAIRIIAAAIVGLIEVRSVLAEEINAHVVVTDWPLADIRHAFEQDDWPIEGTVAESDLRLTGPYEGVLGAEDMETVSTASKEMFDLFMKIHEGFHGAVETSDDGSQENAYESVAENIDAALDQLTSLTANPADAK